jgi:methylated-DNA-[protein]-cysteine S-methyltransferase
MGVLASGSGLRHCSLPRCSEADAVKDLGDEVTQATKSEAPFADLIDRFKAYFRSETADFPDKLDLSGATDFQRQVWETTRTIPRSETRSYEWIAVQIGKPKAARAVGQALGQNPIPIIIPCHRVLTSDGKLGGFTGGLDMKRLLLKMEGATVLQ